MTDDPKWRWEMASGTSAARWRVDTVMALRRGIRRLAVEVHSLKPRLYMRDTHDERMDAIPPLKLQNKRRQTPSPCQARGWG